MAYTTINKSTDYFNTKLTTGTGNSQAVTGLGFQPDWIWGKRRDSTGHHSLFDAVRGITKGLESNQTGGEWTSTGYYSSFDSDGFTIASGAGGAGNGSGQTAVQWCWKANGTGSANTDGSVNSTVSVNTTAGFSISSYTGTGSAATVGHGLGAVPNVIIIKRLDQASNWCVYHTGLGGADHNVFLNTTSSIQTDTAIWNNTLPTTSVFSLGANADANGSGAGHIAYCFAEKTGYSKFGSYTGNGSASSGTFIYTGFKPAWVLVKRTNASGNNWQLHDIKRTQYAQPINHRIAPNVDLAEQTGDTLGFDFVSNGFRPNNNNADYNNSGSTYIYMAFASAPLVGTNNIPATAR